MLENPDFIGWVRITADDKTLLDFSYEPLRSGVCYKVSLVPEIEPISKNELKKAKEEFGILLCDIEFVKNNPETKKVDMLYQKQS